MFRRFAYTIDAMQNRGSFNKCNNLYGAYYEKTSLSILYFINTQQRRYPKYEVNKIWPFEWHNQLDLSTNGIMIWLQISVGDCELGNKTR